MIGKIIKVRGVDFKVADFLGKWKSGYSYLVENNEIKYVL